MESSEVNSECVIEAMCDHTNVLPACVSVNVSVDRRFKQLIYLLRIFSHQNLRTKYYKGGDWVSEMKVCNYENISDLGHFQVVCVV